MYGRSKRRRANNTEILPNVDTPKKKSMTSDCTDEIQSRVEKGRHVNSDKKLDTCHAQVY